MPQIGQKVTEIRVFSLGPSSAGEKPFAMYKWNVRMDQAVGSCLYGMTPKEVITFIFEK